MRKLWTALLIVAALCATTTRSLADTITVNTNYWGAQKGSANQTLNVTTTGIAGLTNGNHSFGGGLMSLSRTAGSTATFTQTPSGAGFGTPGIGAFCIDLLQTLDQSAAVYDIIDPALAPKGAGNVAMGSAKATALATLWAAYVNPAASLSLPNVVPSLAGGAYLAAQLAIWEIVYEPTLTFDLSNGAFKANGTNSGATALAQSMLTAVSSSYLDPDSAKADLKAFSAPSASPATAQIQDLIVEVPEAANIISLAAIGLVAGLFNFRRFRRKSAT